MIKNNKAILMLVLITLAWGTSFPVMKMALDNYPFYLVVAFRFGLASLVLLPLVLLSHRKQPIQWLTVKQGIFLGVVLFTTFSLFMFGLTKTTAAKTGFLSSLAVIWVPIFNKILFKKNISWVTGLSIVLALIGMGLIVDLHEFKLNTGDALVILGSIFGSILILSIDRVGHPEKGLGLAFFEILMMAVLSSIACLALEQAQWPIVLNQDVLLGLILVAVFGTAMTAWLHASYQGQTSPVTAAIIFNLEPIFTMLFAMILLGEILNTQTMVGASIIVLSVLIASMASIFQAKAQIQA